MIDPVAMLRLTGVALGLWGVLSAAQRWVDRRAWREGGALGWDLMGSRRSRLHGSTLLARSFAPGAFEALILVKFAASLLLTMLPISGWLVPVLASLWIVLQLLALRMPPDGADKMAAVVTAGTLLWTIGFTAGLPPLVTAAVLWIGGQLTIAYATSGWAKLALPTWRNGRALTAAMASFGHGHRWAHAVTDRSAAAVAVAWALMLLEGSFPLLLLAPPTTVAAGLAFFFLFHLGTAVFMGLNTYPWAFLAAYPAVLVMSGLLRSAAGL